MIGFVLLIVAAVLLFLAGIGIGKPNFLPGWFGLALVVTVILLERGVP